MLWKLGLALILILVRLLKTSPVPLKKSNKNHAFENCPLLLYFQVLILYLNFWERTRSHQRHLNLEIID